MYRVFAAELMIWSMACIAKLKVMNSQIGLRPAIAAPVAMPVKPACMEHALFSSLHFGSTCEGRSRRYRGKRDTHSPHLSNWRVPYALCSILLQKAAGDLQARRSNSDRLQCSRLYYRSHVMPASHPSAPMHVCNVLCKHSHPYKVMAATHLPSQEGGHAHLVSSLILAYLHSTDMSETMKALRLLVAYVLLACFSKKALGQRLCAPPLPEQRHPDP